jgi:hypothetical protein
MPYPKAKYPPTHDMIRLLLEALEPFAFLLENPVDYPDKEGEWLIQTNDFIKARMAFCRVATAIGLTGYGGDA